MQDPTLTAEEVIKDLLPLSISPRACVSEYRFSQASPESYKSLTTLSRTGPPRWLNHHIQITKGLLCINLEHCVSCLYVKDLNTDYGESN